MTIAADRVSASPTLNVIIFVAFVAITLFVAATIALVMTDIKKILAYSTVSQLGFMMLGLGVGGWVAGLFHLLTHAFFKALLFLGSGSVIYGCHHEQEITKMGGLYPKMKATALTMLIGCLAIAGTPLFSGWYSKDAILASAFGFGMVHTEHILLFILPLVTAGDRTYGVIQLDTQDRAKKFNKGDLELLLGVASQASVASIPPLTSVVRTRGAAPSRR